MIQISMYQINYLYMFSHYSMSLTFMVLNDNKCFYLLLPAALRELLDTQNFYCAKDKFANSATRRRVIMQTEIT